MKKRNEKLIQKADEVLNNGSVGIISDLKKGSINEAYNGQIAALGVTIAICGLRPALAIYYHDNPNTKCNKREIIEAIAQMINDPSTNSNFISAKSLLRYVIHASDGDLKGLKKEIIDCSVALKQVVRTYNLVPDANR